MKNFAIPFCHLAVWALLLGGSLRAQEIRTEEVRFEKGASSAVVEGQIQGYETVDYLLRVSAGQYMNVSMATDNGANYFNIMEPGEEYVAIYNGATSGNRFEGTTARSGTYRIRVYLMRSAARRNETASYRLEMIVASQPSESENRDALVPGTPYHATGQVACTMEAGQPAGNCDFGVVREGYGGGMVTITKPDRRTRTIFFTDGQATGYDMSQADPGEFRASKEGDMYIIWIGEEKYEFPEALI